MKIDVLVDNNTLIDRYFKAEPGFSLLIRHQNTRLLFDTGYSDLFLSNAAKMGRDLSSLDYLVISHSHLDHTWGLDPFIRYLTELGIENRPLKSPVLLGHPGIFTSSGMEGFPEFGSLLSKEKLERHMRIRLEKAPVSLAPGLTFLGEIPRENDFEGKETFGRKGREPDRVMDDSALVFESDQGLVIMTGCAHAGICNTIAHAQKVCNEKRVADIIGGFHLQTPDPVRLARTIDFLSQVKPNAVHACHCTDLASKIALARAVNILETGVGLTLDYNAKV